MWRLALLLIVLCFPAPAFAWRQTMTCLLEEPPAPTATPFCVGNERPKPLTWGTNEVHYVVNERGSDDFPTNDGLIDPQLLDVINASFQTWNEPECSDFMFVYDGLSAADSFDRNDELNLVVFQDEDWPYSGMALAVTTVTATLDGQITNADLELNGVTHEFAFVTETGMGVWDVQNTVTHEAGHIAGFDHDAVEDSTMEFEAQRGETNKRDLHPDDIEGLCTVYPLASEMEPEPGAPADDGCCRTAGHGASPPSLLLLALLALLWRRRDLSFAYC